MARIIPKARNARRATERPAQSSLRFLATLTHLDPDLASLPPFQLAYGRVWGLPLPPFSAIRDCATFVLIGPNPRDMAALLTYFWDQVMFLLCSHSKVNGKTVTIRDRKLLVG